MYPSRRKPRVIDEDAYPIRLNPGCAMCPFATRGQGFVGGEGPIATATIWLVGQDPGEHEFHEGRPFVEWAASGKYVNAALKLAGVRREGVYVTNVRKCWPPDGASPKDMETALGYCAKYLDEEMAKGKPNVIIAIGADAMKRLTGRGELIKKWQGSTWKAEELGDGSNANVCGLQDVPC